jgi:hypothetical protein
MDENIFEVACNYYEICGATYATFLPVEIGDEYVCPECYDQEDMFMFGWAGVSHE